MTTNPDERTEHDTTEPRVPAPPGEGHDEREERTPTLLEQLGGVAGLVYSSVPVVVFVIVNALTSLMPAIWAAVGIAVAITVLRVVRKEPLQPAISGFFGVAICAFIAYRSGSAKDFFLFGIWASVGYFSALMVSVLVRWPLVGVVWNYLNGTGQQWRRHKFARRSYDIATLACASVFAARFVVQRWLYDEDQTGWLAVAKIGMGAPLWALALLVVVWAVRRSDKHLKTLLTDERESDADIEARLRAKYGGRPASGG